MNYFESDINKEDVYFFQPIRSAKFDDLRENGYMITNKGLRYCIESDGKRYQNMVPFYRLKEVYIDENHKLVCKHIDSELITRETVIESKYITEFKRFFECIVESGINAIESCKGVWSVNVNENENVIEKDLLPRTSAGLGAERANEVWKKENKNYLNASQGGGYGAEYGNNTIDRLMGKDVVKLHNNWTNQENRLRMVQIEKLRCRNTDKILQDTKGNSECRIWTRWKCKIYTNRWHR